MRHQCILTGITFDAKNRDEHICPDAAERIVNLVMSDKSLQRRVSAEILGNAETMRELAQAIMNVRASEIGLSYPGTISEFFLELRDNQGN